MMPRTFLRGRHGGFSALYGAFGVVLVSAAVAGIVMASMSAHPATSGERRQQAEQFLDTVLRSHIDHGITLHQALAFSCFDSNCPGGSWNATALARAIAGLAVPLARALDDAFQIAVTAENQTQLRVGPADPSPDGVVAEADIFRPAEGDFVGLSLYLEPAL